MFRGSSRGRLRTSIILLSLTSYLLSGCQLGIRYMIERETRDVSGPVLVHGVYVSGQHVYSFSMLPGEDSFIEEKREFHASEGAIDFWAVANAEIEHIKSETIERSVNWVRALFPDQPDVNIEIVMIPDGLSHQDISRYKRADAKLTFWFPDDETTADLIGTLSHELTHYYVATSERKAPNRLSDEVSARLVEVCVKPATGQEIPDRTSNIRMTGLPGNLSGLAYDDLLHVVSNGSDTLRSIVIADTILEHFRRNGTEADLLDYCRRIIQDRVDFEVMNTLYD